MPADRTAGRRMLELMTMHTSQASFSVGELEKAKMSVTDLKNHLGLAEAAVLKE